MAKTDEIVLLGGADRTTTEINKLVSQLPPAVSALTGVDLSGVSCNTTLGRHGNFAGQHWHYITSRSRIVYGTPSLQIAPLHGSYSKKMGLELFDWYQNLCKLCKSSSLISLMHNKRIIIRYKSDILAQIFVCVIYFQTTFIYARALCCYELLSEPFRTLFGYI